MGSVKETVLSVLAVEDGLRLTDIHKRLLSRFHLRSSVQATRKALLALLSEKVVEKRGTGYSISLQWVLEQKSFLDQVLLSRTRKRLSALDLPGKSNEFVFENLFELDNFWNALLLQLAEKENKKEWIAWDNFLWFFIINIGFETALVNELHQKGFRCFVGARKGFGINDWAFGIYRSLGVRTVLLPEKAVSAGVDLNVLGDYIIEVSFDEKVFKKIASIFSKYTRLEDIPLSVVGELSTMKGKHVLRLIHSPVLAENLRNRFKELSKKGK